MSPSKSRAGTTLAIVGESGSGKSTLARAIVGLDALSPLAPYTSTARTRSRRALAERAYHREVAMMFQDPVSSLSPRRTVKSLIAEPFIVHGMKEKDLATEARRLLALVGLPKDFASRYPHQLSGGQARRVGVARAIALNPKLIIADEPTAGLDVSVQGEILNLLARLQGEFGLTYVIITHNLAVVRHVSDETAIMYMGRFVEQGRTAEVFARSCHPYTQGLIAAQPHPDPAKRRTGIVLTGRGRRAFATGRPVANSIRAARARGNIAIPRAGDRNRAGWPDLPLPLPVEPARSARAAVKSNALFFSESNARFLVIGEDGNDARTRTLRGRDAMRRIAAAKHIERSRRQFEDARRRIGAEKQARHAIVIGVAVAAQIGAVFKLAACFRHLQEQCRRELRSVEMPVQGFAIAILHDIGTRERVGHDVEFRLLHDVGKERPPWADTHRPIGPDFPPVDRCKSCDWLS